jgi:hypothetical protein
VDDSITRILRPRERARTSALPEANSEYSRGSGPFGRLVRARRPGAPQAGSPRSEAAGGARTALAVGALLGALLVVIAQFTALYHLHSTTSSAAIRTVGTGDNHAWAPIPLALVALALSYAVYRFGSRAALVGLASLGIATLAIALLGDLPDARSSGLIGSGASGYVQATSSPSAGLYMETLGAVILLVSGGVGFMMLAPAGDPRSTPARRAAAPSRPVLVVEQARTKLDLQTRKPDR